MSKALEELSYLSSDLSQMQQNYKNLSIHTNSISGLATSEVQEDGDIENDEGEEVPNPALNCAFCPKLTSFAPAAMMLNRALFLKYSSSQNYFYTKEVTDFVENTRKSTVIRWKDANMVEEDEEYLTRYYEYKDFDRKLKMLTEYYKFHRDIPRMFMLPTTTVLNRFHDRKRRIEYFKIKKIIEEQKRQKQLERGEIPVEQEAEDQDLRDEASDDAGSEKDEKDGDTQGAQAHATSNILKGLDDTDMDPDRRKVPQSFRNEMNRRPVGGMNSMRKINNELSYTIQELNSYLSHVIDKGKQEGVDTDFDGISQDFKINDTNFSIFLKNEEKIQQKSAKKAPVEPKTSSKPNYSKPIEQFDNYDVKEGQNEEAKKRLINREIFKKPKKEKIHIEEDLLEEVLRKKINAAEVKETKVADNYQKERDQIRENCSPAFEKKYFSPKEPATVQPQAQSQISSQYQPKNIQKINSPAGQSKDQSSTLIQRQKQMAILEKIKTNIENNQARLSSSGGDNQQGKILIYKSPQKNENILQFQQNIYDSQTDKKNLVVTVPSSGGKANGKTNVTSKSATNHSSILQENLKDFSKIFIQNLKQSFTNSTGVNTPFDNNKFSTLSVGPKESPNPMDLINEFSAQGNLKNMRQPSNSLQNFMKAASYSTIKKDVKVNNLTLPQSEKDRILKLLGRQPQTNPVLIKSASTASSLKIHPYNKGVNEMASVIQQQNVPSHQCISGSVSPSKLRRNLSNSGNLGSAGKNQESQIRKKNQRTLTAQSPLSFSTRNQPSPLQSKQRNFPGIPGSSGKLDSTSPQQHFASVGINPGVLHRVLNIFHNCLVNSPSSTSNIKNKKQTAANRNNNSANNIGKGSQKIINNVNIVNYVNNVISSAEILGKSTGFTPASFSANTGSAYQDMFDANNSHNKSQERKVPGGVLEDNIVLRSNKSAEKIYSQNPFSKHKSKASMKNFDYTKATREEDLRYKENVMRNEDVYANHPRSGKNKKGPSANEKKLKDFHRLHGASNSTNNIPVVHNNSNPQAGNSFNTSGHNNSRISSNDSYRKNKDGRQRNEDHQELLNIAAGNLSGQSSSHHHRQKSLPIQKNFGIHFTSSMNGGQVVPQSISVAQGVSLDNGTPKVRKNAKNGSLSFEKSYKNQANGKILDDQNNLMKQAIYDKLNMLNRKNPVTRKTMNGRINDIISTQKFFQQNIVSRPPTQEKDQLIRHFLTKYES